MGRQIEDKWALVPRLLPFSPLKKLLEFIFSQHPNTGVDSVLEGAQWSVDTELIYDPDSFVLRGGEEVAVIPPVSGG